MCGLAGIPTGTARGTDEKCAQQNESEPDLTVVSAWGLGYGYIGICYIDHRLLYTYGTREGVLLQYMEHTMAKRDSSLSDVIYNIIPINIWLRLEKK